MIDTPQRYRLISDEPVIFSRALSERGAAGSTDVHHFIRAEERNRAAYAKIAADCARLGIEVAIAQSAAKDGEAMAGVLRRALARLELPPAALDRAHEFVYEELLALSGVEDAE